MKYTKYSKDLNKYETARQNTYYDEKDDGTLVTCGNAIDKLGKYENVDDDPEHLAKIKQALEIIVNKGVNVGYFIDRIKSKSLNYKEYVREQKIPYLDFHVSIELLTREEFNFLRRCCREILNNKKEQNH